jgi:hypothetical protein
MKKFILPLLGLVSLPAIAGVDTSVYEDVEDMTCTNVWSICRNNDNGNGVEEWNASKVGEFNNKTRSMVVVDNKLVVAQSKTITVSETESNDYATLLIYNMFDGSFEKEVQVTVDGEKVSGLLCANQIGVDDYGNVWLCGLVINSGTTPFKIYRIKDIYTGEAELAAELSVPAEENAAWGRHDYYDLVGDITGKQAGAVFMTPVANGASPFVAGFVREQGSDEWGPKMDGDYYVLSIEETYPADQVTWNGAPMVRIVRDEEHSGDVFYIDAFVTAPTLYNNTGTMLDSFAANPDLCPKVGPNGCVEFTMNGKTYFAFTRADYDVDPGSQISLCQYGDDLTFASLKLLWNIPANGLGTISDTGTRMFGICPTIFKDENGVEGMYLSLLKCNNGIAVYKIAPKGWNDPNAHVDAVVIDNEDAPAVHYDMMGRRVDNPLPGTLVITRQGAKAFKEIIK